MGASSRVPISPRRLHTVRVATRVPVSLTRSVSTSQKFAFVLWIEVNYVSQVGKSKKSESIACDMMV